MFNAHFLMTSIAGGIGTVIFAMTGRPVFAVGVGLITAFAVWARGWFLRQWDIQLSARDAGDADAVRRLRRLHWGGMLSNAVQLVAIVCQHSLCRATATCNQHVARMSGATSGIDPAYRSAHAGYSLPRVQPLRILPSRKLS